MAESRNKKYSSERNQLVAMPPIVTTVLGTELGTTLLFGFKQQHHCRDGLLPLLVTLPLIMAESRPSSSSVLARPRGWHAFVERLVGTIRREYLDRTLFWATADLEDKLLDFRTYFNHHRSHTALEGRTPDQDAPMPRPVANLHSYGWQGHCRGLYHTPMAA